MHSLARHASSQFSPPATSPPSPFLGGHGARQPILPLHRAKSPPPGTHIAAPPPPLSQPAATAQLLPKLAMKRVKRMLRGFLAAFAVAVACLHLYSDHFGYGRETDLIRGTGEPVLARVADPHSDEALLPGSGATYEESRRAERREELSGSSDSPAAGRGGKGSQKSGRRQRGGAGARALEATKRKRPDYVDDEEIEAEQLASGITGLTDEDLQKAPKAKDTESKADKGADSLKEVTKPRRSDVDGDDSAAGRVEPKGSSAAGARGADAKIGVGGLDVAR